MSPGVNGSWVMPGACTMWSTACGGVGPSLKPGALKSLRALSARGSLMTLAKVGEDGGDEGGGGSVMGSCS